MPTTSAAAVPAGQRTLTHGPAGTSQIALTVDDGYCDQCVGGYVTLAQRTGIHLTLSPNGTYSHIWSKYAERLKPLLERRQVQIINHTFSHKDLRRMTEPQIAAELERNDDWVHATFGTTTRPYYRPPFGFRNAHVDEVTAKLGYTSTVLWNGSYSDSESVTPQFLMTQARKYLTRARSCSATPTIPPCSACSTRSSS